MKEWSSEIKT